MSGAADRSRAGAAAASTAAAAAAAAAASTAAAAAAAASTAGPRGGASGGARAEGDRARRDARRVAAPQVAPPQATPPEVAPPRLGRPWFGRRPEPDAPCPACGSGHAVAFYAVAGIPVHSCLLMATRAEALAYPRRDLRLARCPGCGFVFNAIFDPGVHEYSPRYEETQGCSPTFSAFAGELARRLLARYRLRGRRVLEIGCGKGEFLLQLCRAGDCAGVGIDPSYVRGRLPLEPGDRLTFLQEPYGPQHASLAADFIACRHTLEHIADVRRFLAAIVDSLDGRSDVDVWIEVPDVGRVLEEGAFWDVYYEHCSYFTPGSLARLYRAAGLVPDELGLEFDDQYVVIGGRLRGDATAGGLEAGAPGPGPLEEPPSASDAALDRFLVTGPRAVDRWRRTLAAVADAGDTAVIWGAGSKGVAFLTTLGDAAAAVAAAVDVNPRKQGKFMPGTGHAVVAPSDLPALRPTLVVVMNPVYVPEIRRDLARLGLDPVVQPVHDAAYADRDGRDGAVDRRRDGVPLAVGRSCSATSPASPASPAIPAGPAGPVP